MILQHERQGNFAPSHYSQALVNAAKTNKNSKLASRVYSFYGKDNHIVDNCFKEHGGVPCNTLIPHLF
jgi:hypothetical protein